MAKSNALLIVLAVSIIIMAIVGYIGVSVFNEPSLGMSVGELWGQMQRRNEISSTLNVLVPIAVFLGVGIVVTLTAIAKKQAKN